MPVRPTSLVFAGGQFALIPDADVSSLKPLGWGADRPSSGGWRFTSRDGYSQARVHLNTVSDPARLAQTASRQMRPSGSHVLRMEGPQSMEGGGVMSVGGYQGKSDGVRYIASSAVFPHKLGGHLVCQAYMPVMRDYSMTVQDFLGACEEFAARGEPFDEHQLRTAAQRSAVAAPGIRAGRGRQIEALLFDQYFTSGPGGVVAVELRPVVLYTDGMVCRCLDLPLADIDVSRLVLERPDDVTRWHRQEGDYTFTWPGDREARTVKTRRRKPALFHEGGRLDGFWQNAGTGSAAHGADARIKATTSYCFRRDGTFTSLRPMDGAGIRLALCHPAEEAGQYEIPRDGEIQLSYSDGRIVRTSLLHQEGNVATLWIGGAPFRS